jgi:hypothetical protein
MPDVPADLRFLADRIAIDDLITRYTLAVDDRAWDRLDEVFTPDAQIDYTATGGIAGSFPEVKAWLAETMAMFSAMQHLVCQREVRLDGDRADVRVCFLNPLLIDRPEGPWQMDVGGVYHHELVRTPAGWRSRRLHEELVWSRRP